MKNFDSALTKLGVFVDQALTMVPSQSLAYFGFGFTLVTACVLLLVYIVCLHKDLATVQSLLRNIIRNAQPLTNSHFSSKTVSSVWNTVLALLNKTRISEQSQTIYDEIIALTTRITSTLDDLSATTEEITDLLARQIGPNLLALAIIRKDSTTGTLHLERIMGLTPQRLSSPLLAAFDRLFDQTKNNQVLWGYHLAAQSKLFNFSELGISISLALPLSTPDKAFGALWLGFREGNFALSPGKKKTITAIAEHAAALLVAADRATKKDKQNHDEKSFLLGISHDLKSPGASALYALQDLLSQELGSLSSEQLLRLNIIEQALEEQLGLISDVLDFTKSQKGLLDVRPKPLGINEAIKKASRTLLFAAKQKNIDVRFELLDNQLTDFDPRHFRRIMINLLSNAIKYTDEGVVFVSTQRNGDIMEIAVSDTGLGVPPAEIEKLFGEFSRLSNSSCQNGAGLGLALCKILADQNGAQMFYRPNLGGGSTFGLRVRINPLATNTSLITQSPSISILVIDDDDTVCRMTHRYLLQELDAQISSCSSVKEATSFLASNRTDVLVTDLYLKDEVTTSLLQKFSSIPAVIVTGSADKSSVSSELEGRKYTILEKPVSRDELVSAVKEMVAN